MPYFKICSFLYTRFHLSKGGPWWLSGLCKQTTVSLACQQRGCQFEPRTGQVVRNFNLNQDHQFFTIKGQWFSPGTPASIASKKLAPLNSTIKTPINQSINLSKTITIIH